MQTSQMTSTPLPKHKKSKHSDDDLSARSHGDVDGATATATIVSENSRVVIAPLMDAEALQELLARKHLAGHQVAKQRGVLQFSTLKLLRGDPETPNLGKYIDKLFEFAAAVAQDGKVLNMFLNFNRGLIGDSLVVSDEDDDDFIGNDGNEPSDNTLWHRDSPTRGSAGRIILSPVTPSSIEVRRDDEVIELAVPAGMALMASNRILALPGMEHRHAAKDPGISVVIEMSCPEEAFNGDVHGPYTAAPAAHSRVAIAALPSLASTIRSELRPWEPQKFFEGNKLDWGIGRAGAGGSQWRMAVAYVRGPRLGRGKRRPVSVVEARQIVGDMSAEQREEAAILQGRRIGTS
jgi:hypothetical protein